MTTGPNPNQKVPDENEDKEEEKEQDTQNANYNDADADIELVSSDGITFRVHSYQLQASSPVFRSMISLAKGSEQRTPIVLVDEASENAETVEAVLDLVYHQAIIGLDNIASDPNLLEVVHFAKKWDIQIVLARVHHQLEINLLGNNMGSDLFQFTVAIGLQDIDLAAGFWSIECPETWEIRWDALHHCCEPIETEKYSCPGVGCMKPIDHNPFTELDAIGWREFRRLPSEVIFAMLRSQKLADMQYEASEDEVQTLRLYADVPVWVPGLVTHLRLPMYRRSARSVAI